MQYGNTLYVVVNVIGGLSSNCRKVGVGAQPIRIVTEGTEAHEVMQDYLRITRGATVDRNVYVRLRQRRHTDHA